MPGGLLGTKLGMTQIYDESGTCTPVTVLQVGPCTVVQKKTAKEDGYAAVQIGYQELDEKKLNKPRRGHFQVRKLKPLRYLQEFHIRNEGLYEVGQTLSIALLQVGDRVDIVGTSKGKGFQGVMRRHGHSGGPGAHGSRFHRIPGSIGQCTHPGEVAKGTKLPGRMGGQRVTTRHLTVVGIREAENRLLVRGAVPGPNDGLVFIRFGNGDFEKRVEGNQPKEAPAEEAAPKEEAAPEAKEEKKVEAKEKSAKEAKPEKNIKEEKPASEEKKAKPEKAKEESKDA